MAAVMRLGSTDKFLFYFILLSETIYVLIIIKVQEKDL